MARPDCVDWVPREVGAQCEQSDDTVTLVWSNTIDKTWTVARMLIMKGKCLQSVVAVTIYSSLTSISV
ncbi:hypothetical protein BC629DRAFT_1486660, partial [Irpex lacteus]